MLGFIVFVISLVIAWVLVNKAQQLYMKIIGADVMFFSGKKKLVAIFAVGLTIGVIILQVFFGMD